MSAVFIRGTKKEVNQHLKTNKDIRTLEYKPKSERQAMLSEYPTGVSINLWTEHDTQMKPIIKTYGVYNKIKNKIE